MTNITVRDIDAGIVESFKVWAALHNRSLSAEIRETLLRSAAGHSPRDRIFEAMKTFVYHTGKEPEKMTIRRGGLVHACLKEMAKDLPPEERPDFENKGLGLNIRYSDIDEDIAIVFEADSDTYELTYRVFVGAEDMSHVRRGLELVMQAEAWNPKLHRLLEDKGYSRVHIDEVVGKLINGESASSFESITSPSLVVTSAETSTKRWQTIVNGAIDDVVAELDKISAPAGGDIVVLEAQVSAKESGIYAEVVVYINLAVVAE